MGTNECHRLINGVCDVTGESCGGKYSQTCPVWIGEREMKTLPRNNKGCDRLSKTLYGDAFILLKFDSVDCGEPQKLHDIFDMAIQHGARLLKNPHPLNIHQRVLNGLDRDNRFEKSYINYTGICKRPARVFTLKNKEIK